MPTTIARPRRACTRAEAYTEDAPQHAPAEAPSPMLRALLVVESFPALAEARDRLLAVAARETSVLGETSAVVESDPGLTMAILRSACALSRRGTVESVPSAVESLGPARVAQVARAVPVFDFFRQAPVWGLAPVRFRLHSLAVQRAAERIACEVGYAHRPRLATTSLLHDLGKLVLMQAKPGYPGQVGRMLGTPEERLHDERRELGVDHALVGAVLLRRWGLSGQGAKAVERHHDAVGEEEAAMIRLADMLAHYEAGAPISPSCLERLAAGLSLAPERVRRILYDNAQARSLRRRECDCPLTRREFDVLQRLAAGRVSKQIGQDLGISASVVRTHLHNVYEKLGAADRAQAVLIATDNGWI
jgi:putative nucleotidyltransferase with HDIG domain